MDIFALITLVIIFQFVVSLRFLWLVFQPVERSK